MRLAGLATLALGVALAAQAAPPEVKLVPGAKADLETAAVEAAAASPALSATGSVLDPAPFVQSFLARATAQRAAEIAERELHRVTALHRHADNASEREVEAARLAEARARAERIGAEAGFAAVWGPELAARADLPALVESLARRGRAMARLELPAGASLGEAPRLVRVSAPLLGRARLPAELLGPAPTTDPTLQGAAFLVLLGEGAPAPGSALLAELASASAAAGSVEVPDSALVWHDGHALVFVAHGADTFERRPVVVGGALAAGWQVKQGLAAGERVVTRGAQQLLSSEILPASPGD